MSNKFDQVRLLAAELKKAAGNAAKAHQMFLDTRDNPLVNKEEYLKQAVEFKDAEVTAQQNFDQFVGELESSAKKEQEQ